MLHNMPLVPTITLDTAKLYELIGPGWGSKKAFALRIGRHPTTIRNLGHDPRVSVKFAGQMAAALNVTLAEITLTEDDGNDEEGSAEAA